MNTNIKRGIVTGALSLSLLGGSVAGVAANHQGNQGNQGGAAGLVAAIVQLNNTSVEVIDITDSFNNLRALNNVLNNSPILSNNNIPITILATDVVDVGDVTVGDITLNALQIAALNNFLNNVDLVVNDVVVTVLSTGDLLVQVVEAVA